MRMVLTSVEEVDGYLWQTRFMAWLDEEIGVVQNRVPSPIISRLRISVPVPLSRKYSAPPIPKRF